MKKHYIALLVAALPAASYSSSVELIGGWNFGQFLQATDPILDPNSFEVVGSIAANFTNSVSPGPEDSGVAHATANTLSDFSAGSGVLYFNGTSSSGNWGTSVKVNDFSGLDATNSTLVNGLTMFGGDEENLNLRFTSGAVTDFSIKLNTTGFADFLPGDFSQPNDFNMTLSAFRASGASASIEWFVNGSSIGTSTTASGATGVSFQAFSVDLPVAFYGQSEAILVGRVTGDIVIDHVQINGVASAIPEPSTYAALAGVVGLGLAALRRRRSV
jgi:hypothetical protein